MAKVTQEALELSRFVSEFTESYAPKILTNSPHTVEGYEITLTLYVAYLEEHCGITSDKFSASCFDKKHIDDWKIWLMSERGNSAYTVNKRVSSLRAFIKYLSSRNIKYLYLLSEAKSVGKQPTTKRKVAGLSREAVKAIMDAPNVETKTGIRDLALIVTLYGTAARIDEVLSIKLCDIHLNSKNPYINIIGKREKERTLYLLPKAVAHLELYMKIFHGDNANPDRILFYSNHKGVQEKLSQSAVRQRLGIYAKIAHEVCADVPLDLHAHQFRHAKATHWLEDGMNIAQISELLGHESVETTMKYLDISLAQVQQGLATLEDENDKNAVPKWNPQTDTLAGLCGLRKLKKQPKKE